MCCNWWEQSAWCCCLSEQSPFELSASGQQASELRFGRQCSASAWCFIPLQLLQDVRAGTLPVSLVAVGDKCSLPATACHEQPCMLHNATPPAGAVHDALRAAAPQHAILFAEPLLVVLEHVCIQRLKQPRKLCWHQAQLHTTVFSCPKHWLLQMCWTTIQQQHGNQQGEVSQDPGNSSQDCLHEGCIHPPRFHSQQCDVFRYVVLNGPLRPHR